MPYKEPRYRSFLDKWGLVDWGRRSTCVPAGWCDIVDRLMIELTQVPGWSPEFVQQIKSKFAGLSFYYALPEGFNEALRAKVKDLVEQAEAEAWKTCEGCGTTEAVTQASTNTHWRVTECPTCLAESNSGDRRFR